MRCPGCGENFVVDGYCGACRERLGIDAGLVLPARDGTAPAIRPSILDRLMPQRGREALRLLAGVVPGLGLWLSGERRRGGGVFLVCLVLAIGSLATATTWVSLLLLSAAFSLAASAAGRIASRNDPPGTRAAAFRQSLCVAAVLMVGYFLIYQFASLFLGVVNLRWPAGGGEFLEEDRLILAWGSGGEPGDWVLAQVPEIYQYNDANRLRFGPRSVMVLARVLAASEIRNRDTVLDARGAEAPRLVASGTLTLSPDDGLLRLEPLRGAGGRGNADLLVAVGRDAVQGRLVARCAPFWRARIY